MSRSLTLSLILLLAMTHAAAQRWHPPASPPGEGCQAKYRSAPVLQNPAFTSGQRDEFDATYYHLDLTVAPSAAFLAGRVRIRGEIRADSLREVLLDLSAPMTIDSVVSLGKRLLVTRYTQSFSVTLPQTARQGADVTLDVFYRGTPVPTGFGSFIFSSFEGDPWVWSLSQPYGARDWWPCNDHPLDKADSVDIWITCSAGLKVGSNGKLMGIRTNGNGTRTHMWSERYPIASYLVSVAVANYAEFSNWFRYSSTDSLQILNYVLPHNLAEAQRTLPKTVNMLEIFSGLYGPYPFLKEKYGHSEFGRGGAMEHQTMTSTITFEEDVVAHELAHQWFGDLITCANWQHLWLNEGFATYSEALYREQRYGPAEYWRLMQARLTSALNAQGSLYLRDTSSVADMFAVSRVYAKGASVLHMLRHVLGDSLFFRSIRAYADDPRYRYANVTTEGFRSVCEQVSGTNLARFFEQWVYGENYPRYYVSWKTQPDGARHRVLLHVRQETRTNTPQFFSMPVDCKVSSAGIDTTMVLRNDSLVQDFSFTVGFKPDRLEIDPNGWILREVFDENAPLPTQVRLDQNYPNPFNAGTTIAFHLPHRSPVTLSIYNVMGELIAVPVDEQRDPGFHTATWKGAFSSGVMAPSGVYFYRLVAEGSQITRRMILLR